eukprot:3237350-Rhodomonas_salina.1
MRGGIKITLALRESRRMSKAETDGAGHASPHTRAMPCPIADRTHIDALARCSCVEQKREMRMRCAASIRRRTWLRIMLSALRTDADSAALTAVWLDDDARCDLQCRFDVALPRDLIHYQPLQPPLPFLPALRVVSQLWSISQVQQRVRHVPARLARICSRGVRARGGCAVRRLRLVWYVPSPCPQSVIALL